MKTHLRILSWNVNGLCARLPYLPLPSPSLPHPPSSDDVTLRLHSFLSPFDIVCLQETKLSSADTVCSKAFGVTQLPGWRSFWAFPSSDQKKGWSGCVTFIRDTIPLSSVTTTFGDDEDFNNEGRVVTSDHGAFLLFNVYFPNGRGETRTDYKMKFYAAFFQHCTALVASGRHVLVIGDLNTCHTPLDIWNPEAGERCGYLDIERRFLDSLLIDGDWIDTFRSRHPTDRVYTWFDYSSRSKGWRLDVALADKVLDEAVTMSTIRDDMDYKSDHCPIYVEVMVEREEREKGDEDDSVAMLSAASWPMVQQLLRAKRSQRTLAECWSGGGTASKRTKL